MNNKAYDPNGNLIMFAVAIKIDGKDWYFCRDIGYGVDRDFILSDNPLNGGVGLRCWEDAAQGLVNWLAWKGVPREAMRIHEVEYTGDFDVRNRITVKESELKCIS